MDRITARLLRRFWLQRSPGYLLAIVAIAGSEVAQVQIPNLLGQFINHFKDGMTHAGVVRYALLLAILGAVWIGAFAVGQLVLGNLSRVFETELRQRLFVHWESLTSHYFQLHSVGDLVNHLANDTSAVREALSSGANQVFQAVFLFPATLYMTIRYIDLRLTLGALIPMLCIPVVIRVFGHRVEQRSRRAKDALSSLSAFAEESFQAIRIVKAMTHESIEGERFAAEADRVVDRQMQQVRINALFQALMPFFSGLSFVVGLMWGGVLVTHHRISLGSFVAFTTYLSMLILPLMQIGFVVNLFQNASASLHRIDGLLAATPEVKDPVHPVNPPGHGEINVRNLTFTYPDSATPALSDMTFHVAVGSTLGIVGRTGSGKTTLLRLILREYDPPPGTIEVDGVDVREMRLHDLRRLITYVPQDGFLFSMTIVENIAFAHSTVDPVQIGPAVEAAQLASTIDTLPQGLNTLVGERGIRLSGGQRQRTAIARALAKPDAIILVLDDSMSAVDSVTETALLDALAPFQRNKTTLIASHRMSTLRDADWILVLEGGALVDQGTHADLMAHNGLYAEMASLQAQGGGDRG